MDIKQLVNESTTYIQNNFNKPISVADISAQAYLSPSYFAYVFRVLTGYTVKNYFNRYRLYRAAEELVTNNKRIIEIAYNAGFLSQESFTRSFAKIYGITPAQFRLQKPVIKPFPPNNIKKEQQIMELMDCFKDVSYVTKDTFFVAGFEVDINYNVENGTDPISNAWEMWNKSGYKTTLPNRAGSGVFGITHSETAESTAKYITCMEVTSLDNLPVGLVGRKFPSSEYAVFKTTLALIWSGEFWRTLFIKWLPQSGYMFQESIFREIYSAFSLYPAIEVYDNDWANTESIMYVYAPVTKKND